MRWAIVLVAVLLVACSQKTTTASFVKVSPTPAETPKAVANTGSSCTEDDGGKNFKERGTTKGIDLTGKPYEYVDECAGTILSENYCDGSRAKTVNQRCARSCERGQCWD